MTRLRTLLRHTFICVALCTLVPATASAQSYTLLPSERPSIDLSAWTPEAGDGFVVDTKNNMGYLVHKNGGYTAFVVATGQRRVVRYIGRTYNAATPNKLWMVKDSIIKGDRTTFGKRGLFFRLLDDGESTPYGIHSHRSYEEMLNAPDSERFRSMGCVIVDENFLDVVTKTLEVNGGEMKVVTTYGFISPSITYETLRDTVGLTSEPAPNVFSGLMTTK